MKVNGKIKMVWSALFFIVFLLGCEDDDDVGTPILTNENRTVAEAADRIPELSNLIAALTAADGNLLSVLDGAGPFTLFAPTDDAFAELADNLGFGDASDLLEAVSSDVLADILTYHVVPSANPSSQLSDGQELTTVQGESITISTDGGVFVQDKTELSATNTAAAVTKADDITSNGVIHLIDKVLLSQSIIDGLSLDIRPTVFELAADTGNLSLLQAALEKAGLAETLNSSNESGYTVFAPSDDAFVALLGTLGDDYNSLDDFDNDVELNLLTNILLYHVLPQRVESTDLEAGTVETLFEVASEEEDEDPIPQTLEVIASGGGFEIGDVTGDNAGLATVDVDGSNGVVHIVDKVLLPQAALDFLGLLASDDLATIVTTTPDLSLLGEALVKTELAELFVDATNESGVEPDNFTYFNTATVFAPTNAAFADLLTLLGDDYNSLDDFDTDEELELLTQILLFHVSAGSTRVDDFVPNTTLATQLEGASLDVIFSFDDNAFVIGDATNDTNANIAIPDVPARNGVAHVIDKVLLPGEAVVFLNSLNEEEEE